MPLKKDVDDRAKPGHDEEMDQPHEDHADIRASVRALCADFPGEYWRTLDRERGYPTEFVAALTKAGFLAALIPEQYGGSGLPLSAAAAIMEEIHASGCNGAACHAQMYTMGTLLRHGSEAQKERYLPAIAKGELRLQAFGVTEPTSGTDTLNLRTTAVRDGDALRRQRPEDLDLARRAFRSDAASRAHHPARAGEIAHRRAFGIFGRHARRPKASPIRPIRTMMNHATTEIFIDDLRVPAENLIGEEGEGFPLHPLRHERRAHPDRRRMHRRRQMVHREGHRLRQGTNVFGRPIGQNQGVQFPIARAYAQMRAAELMVREAAALYEAARDCGAEANMAKMLAADASWAAAEMCVQTHGGFGFAEEFDIERKFRETRLYQVAPISTNLILSYLAEHVLGLPRSY